MFDYKPGVMGRLWVSALIPEFIKANVNNTHADLVPAQNQVQILVSYADIRFLFGSEMQQIKTHENLLLSAMVTQTKVPRSSLHPPELLKASIDGASSWVPYSSVCGSWRLAYEPETRFSNRFSLRFAPAVCTLRQAENAFCSPWKGEGNRRFSGAG
jgi:hypothetical protein